MEFLKGGSHKDDRGTVLFNNSLDLSRVKRMYTIENRNTEICRAWQGHRIESRWFIAVRGSFEIKITRIASFEDLLLHTEVRCFLLQSISMDSLYIEKGYASSIQALEPKSKLVVLSDYHIGEAEDNYKFDSGK